MTRGRIAWILLLFGTAAGAQDHGPDTCIQGYVWREAFPGDHVCVDPSVRAQAAEDNRLAGQRRESGGGAYGPDTCRAGFVWREARPDDHVCVTPETRTQAARDNRAVQSRYVRAPGEATRPPVGLRADVAAAAPVAGVVNPQVPQEPPPAVPGSPLKRGFDEIGDPYVQVTLPDGTIRREQRKGITVIKPDGTSQFYRHSYIMSNAQPPTPPELPSDPALGRAWVSFHNDELGRLIGELVENDASEMQKFTAAEAQAVGSDVFRQIEYRTRVIDALVRP